MITNMKHSLLTLAAMLSLAGAVFADHTPSHTKTLVLKNKEGAAILGYDPVSYFTDNKPARGNPKLKTTYEGASYYFTSAGHKAMFDANPSKYVQPMAAIAATQPASLKSVPATRSSGRSSTGDSFSNTPKAPRNFGEKTCPATRQRPTIFGSA